MRKEIVVNPQTEVMSDVTGRTMTVATSDVPAPVKLTIEGIADGKPFKKVLSGLDFLPTEWDGLREFADTTDHSENPLISFWTPVKSASNGAGKSADPLTAEMRTWARANGHPELGERGRVPAEIKEAFFVANPGKRPAPEPAS